MLRESERADYRAELEDRGISEGRENERAFGFEELRDRL